MTDKELTELAAKASCNAQDGFSPLTDDGDALRLAVKLNMALTFSVNGDMHAEGTKNEYAVENWPDSYAATRRAIVCAAAEIGKAMK